MPLGFGFLIEQQNDDFLFTRPLNAYVTATVEFTRVQNNEATVLFGWIVRTTTTWRLSWIGGCANVVARLA